MPMPISVNAVGKPSMIATTMSESISRPRWPCVICDTGGSRMMVASTTHAMMMSPNQTPFFMSFRFLGNVGVELLDVLVLHVHHRLQLVDVDLLHVLDARGPFALLDAHDAAQDLDHALHEQEDAGDRDEGLERVDGRAVGHDRGML